MSTNMRMPLAIAFVSACTMCVHALAYFTSDIVSNTDRMRDVWTSLLLYQVIVIAPLFAARRSSFQSLERLMSAVSTVLPALLGVAVVGVVLHWDAKLRLLGASSLDCWAQLRMAWLSQPAEIPAWWRAESMLGHLLSSVGYAGAFYSAACWMTSRTPIRFAASFAAFSTVVVAYAMAIVSRSVMLVFLTMVTMAVLLPFVAGLVPTRQAIARGSTIVGLLAASVLAITVGLFANAMTCGPGNARAYEDGFMDELPITRRSNPNALQTAARKHCPTCNSVLLYINHGMHNFARIATTEDRGDPVLFTFAHYWASKLKLTDPPRPRKRVYDRGGATLPGAAYHDFGPIGVVLVALLHGVALLIGTALIGRNALAAVLGICLYAGGGISLALSGMFIGPAAIAFPFVMFAIGITPALAFLRLRVTRFLATPQASQSVPGAR